MVIRTSDHLPPHVHVLKAGGEVKISLGGDTVAPAVIENWRLSAGDVLRAYQIVAANQALLLKKWRQIHG